MKKNKNSLINFVVFARSDKIDRSEVMDLFNDEIPEQAFSEDPDIFSWLMNEDNPFPESFADTNPLDLDTMPDHSFDWADGLISKQKYANAYPLTDDILGAMDVVMGGGDGLNVSQVNAMQEFASEAAGGSRRRESSTYYQNQEAYREPYKYSSKAVESGSDDGSSPALGLGSVGNRHKNGQPMSPKSLAQREKNREAVRNCRKRKREYAQKLQERESLLEDENSKLKLQLKLGSEDMQNQQRLQCLELADSLKTSADQKQDPEKYRKVLETYLGIHGSQTRNREEATKHILSRIIRQVEPTHVTKMYLWQMTQSNAYFKSSGGLWDQLGSQLNLTHEQQLTLKNRKPGTLEICKDIAAILKQLEFMHTNIIEKQASEDMVKLFDGICKVLTVEQRAHFITLLHEEKHLMLMNTDWARFLMAFDPEVDQEHVDHAGDWIVHNPSSASVLLSARRPSYETDTQDDDALSRKRHVSARVLRELFEKSEDELQEYANGAFASDIHLYDPNIPKARVIKGVNGMLSYIKRIRLSFSGLDAKEESFMTRKNLGRGRWTISGQYFGSKKTTLSERDREVIERGSHIAKLAPEEGKHVSFKVVIALKYVPGSAKIQQVMVSWAALEVMRQLGILGSSISSIGDRMTTLQDVLVEGTSKKTPPVLQPRPDDLAPLDQKLKEKMCIDLTRIFESDSTDERLDLAADLMDDKCVSQDANMGGAAFGPGGFIDYVRRLRRPFSTLQMTKHNFVGLAKKKKSKGKKQQSEDTIPATADATLQFGCLVKGMYTGALTSNPRPYEFNVTIFVSFNLATNKIAELEMSWNAASLMRQLGVLH